MANHPAQTTAKLADLVVAFREEEDQLRQGGGKSAIERQHSKGRLTARERIARLVDPGGVPMELSLWAGWQMYDSWGGSPAAGVVTAIGRIAGRRHMIVANDATVKAGAFFPATAKKVLRAQRIAWQNRLPLVYLVDSAGIFLPLADEVFPDEDDFGRIFRNNAVLSAAGVGQIAAIMGNCVAGGGYLPVLCDKTLMTEGSGLYLAGPALVRAAIGQEVSHEELGGAAMHATVSGSIDYREKDDDSCLERIRRLAGLLPVDAERAAPPFSEIEAVAPRRDPSELYQLFPADPRTDYEVRDVLDCILDADTFEEYRPEFGGTVVCGTARLGGFAIGVVATQHHVVRPANGPMEFGGVLYVDSAEKAARFVMNCNQDWLPIIFFQDVNGFMVGRDSEREGIIKSGAKLVSAIANSRVPKLTVIVGGSFGAGNYALCGKAFDPRLIFAWPTSRTAVMGAEQASGTLLDIMLKGAKRDAEKIDEQQMAALGEQVKADYIRHMDPRYAAARGWVDAIIDPTQTRDALAEALRIATRVASDEPYKLGVFQV